MNEYLYHTQSQLAAALSNLDQMRAHFMMMRARLQAGDALNRFWLDGFIDTQIELADSATDSVQYGIDFTRGDTLGSYGEKRMIYRADHAEILAADFRLSPPPANSQDDSRAEVLGAIGNVVRIGVPADRPKSRDLDVPPHPNPTGPSAA